MAEAAQNLTPGPAEPSQLVRDVFEHRLNQADLEVVLWNLSEDERAALLSKLGDLVRRVSALSEVSTTVSDARTLDELFPRLIALITATLHADRGTIFLFDAGDGSLFSRVAQGEGISEIRIPTDRGIAGDVYSRGEAALINDPYADPRFNPDVDRKTGYRTRNILCAPLRNKDGAVIGVSQVLNKHKGEFTGHDLELLEALSRQGATALQNAMLAEEIERAREEERRILEITSAISSELNIEALLTRIAEASTRLLGADRSSVFLHDPASDELWSLFAEGMATKEIRIPADAGLIGACFGAGQPINVPDAYGDARFNRAVDRASGYRTRTILCMPIVDKHGGKLGVIQVLNKHAGPFAQNDEQRLRTFAAQMAAALENARLFEDVLNARNYNESILKSLSNGVITLDADRRVVKANTAARRLLDWHDDDPIGRALADLFAGANAWLEASVAKVAASGDVDNSLDMEIDLDGRTISVNATTVPLIDVKDQGIGSMLVLEDISGEKRVKTTMSRYMPKEVVDKLIESEESVLGGVMQPATVLFSDIRRFTSVAETLGARETVSMLNEYFTDMFEAIAEHGGILDKYIGDAIMALFGTPFRGPDDAENAAAVAADMMRALRHLNARRAAGGREAIEIGIGVATGDVIAGNIGSPKRMDYTVIGDSVNLASRLEGANKVYGSTILLCERTVQGLSHPHALRELDLIQVKGQVQPVAIYELLDYHDEASFVSLEAVLRHFAAGIAAYRQARWAEAHDAFAGALETNPADKVARVFLDRCAFYQRHPPAEDWTGVWQMTTK